MSTISAVEKVIAENGYIVHSISGVSMMPLLRQNQDAVHIVPNTERLKRDDIALYKRRDGSLVLHRVVRVKGSEYIIRGDNCINNERVLESQIIGVAQGIYRDGQYYSCDDETILKYASRQRMNLPYRRLRAFLGRAKRRLMHGK